MSDELFQNLPLTAFPFTIQFVDLASQEKIDEIIVSAPGVLSLPRFGRLTKVVITTADGMVVIAP